jgi:hypothetical protein
MPGKFPNPEERSVKEGPPSSVPRRPRLPVDLGTAAERAREHFAQGFERTAGEVTRVEFQHLSAGTDVLYLGLTFVLAQWYGILLFALGADDVERVRRHLQSPMLRVTVTIRRASHC